MDVGLEQQETTRRSFAPGQQPSRRTDLETASGSPYDQEIDFEDKEGEKNVDVALLFEVAPE